MVLFMQIYYNETCITQKNMLNFSRKDKKMRYDQIRTIQDAYKYFTDCAVANLDYFCLRKSASKSERNRHISICLKMFDLGADFEINLDEERKRFNNLLNIKEGKIK